MSDNARSPKVAKKTTARRPRTTRRPSRVPPRAYTRPASLWDPEPIFHDVLFHVDAVAPPAVQPAPWDPERIYHGLVESMHFDPELV